MTASRAESLPRLDALLLTTFAAVALAVVRVQVAWHPGPVVVQVVCELMAAIGLWALARNLDVIRDQGRRYAAISLITAVLYPVVFEYVQRLLGGSGTSNELTMLVCLQLAAMVLAAFSFLPRLGGTSALLSGFLLLFATTMTTDPFVFVVAGGYGVLGLWWLMGAYWDRIEDAAAASTVEGYIPIRVSVIGATGLMLVLVAGAVGATGASTVVLRGFMPTSGGNQWHDPFARSGVGDGDALVAAKDQALSFGPVESDLFLDSEMPSLYDMFDDIYGDPPNKKRKQQHAVGLAPEERKESEQRIAESRRSGREFSAVRRRVERKREELSDRDAPAMLYVVGRTPLHLDLETYDAFDGRRWEQQTGWDEDQPPILKNRFGKPWIIFRGKSDRSIHRGLNCYAVKVINLKSNRIPAPQSLCELHIDLVDRLDFFDWTTDGMIEMSGREHIPQLTVIHLHSHGMNLHSLRRDWDFSNMYSDEVAQKLLPYLDPMERHKRIADSWVEGVPRGWLQVEEVVDRLRRDYVHEPGFPAPQDCEDVVAHFLAAGEGPDYLFATTAATLLRSLGYPTRLASGFYVRPERHDHRAGQTAVLKQDVHVWAEVCVDGQNWVTIEPTPGYQPPRENLTWKQWSMVVCRRCIEWILRNILSIAIFAVVAAVLVWLRHRWLDLVGLVVCQLGGLRSAESRIIWTIRLLEWRAWLEGRSRPQQATISVWYEPLVSASSDDVRPRLQSFFRWVDHLLYSPRAIRAAQRDELQAACAAAIAASKPGSTRKS